MTLYKNLAQHFINEIQTKQRAIGSRLPPLRTIVLQHQVSMTTAIKAYYYLQQTGWIFAKPQSGYFVANHLQKPTFPTLSSTRAEKRDPKDFVPHKRYNQTSEFFSELGTAMIAPILAPNLNLQRCLKRVTKRAVEGLFFYPENRGGQQLRRALSHHFQKDNLAFFEDDLIITHGCLDAVKLAIETTTKIGDTIAINSPCYSGLLDLLTGLSRNIIEIPCHADSLDLALLEKLMQKRNIQAALFSTSHINPTGGNLSVEQKKQLAFLAETYKTPIIEDDVYFELSHHKHTPLPAKLWDKEGYILWCSSFSKTLAPGLRLGWCLPGRFINQYMSQQSLTDSGVNGLTQSALSEFLNTGDYRTHLNKLRITLNHQINQYRQLLVKKLPNNATVSTPDGGLVLWIHVPNLDTDRLEKLADECQIDIRSGNRFSTENTYKNCLRINCGWPIATAVAETVIEEENHKVRQQIETLCQIINREVSIKTSSNYG
ncbi:PLP-dependent aminotransferase family protein [Marinomonas sp. 15G1-11]|uniref:PLP-dependent aminotransferase family protein n=1 Tax=Marinomonas phaeophyticola TaxID=3004091 RepID=A0ABT4JYH9_9GAMM|nr:PLP-dependent aminotransferase family protein [Marinomonas sp. 15G1-11]MCZ2723471.1 PLP-dependent aminotransferase family protein [Marinomonas sp. 15G1-11]